MRNTLLLMVIGCLALHNVAKAEDVIQPSFDCKKASTAVEKNICGNEKLAALDKQVSDAFFDLKKNPDGRIKVSAAELLKYQREWLKHRGDDYCWDECLVNKYKDRLTELSFPGAPKVLDAGKLYALKRYLTGESCQSLIPILNSQIFVTDGLDTLACKIYEANPNPILSDKKVPDCNSSNTNNNPECANLTELKKINGLQEFTGYLNSLYGSAPSNNCVTFSSNEITGSDSRVLLTLYDINYANTHPKVSQGYYPNKFESDPVAPLKHFSLQGFLEKAQYAKFLDLQAKAQVGLEKYYIEAKQLSADEAKRVAEAHLADLTNLYISSHYANSNDWNLDKVDDFLKSGALPGNDNFEYDTVLHLNYPLPGKEQAKPEILAYFLKLAVVNDYPKDAIEKIIAAGANLQNPKLSDNALMNSVKKPEIMKLLIDKGANINAQNEFGKTALMYAIQYGNLDTVKMLVDHKADINLATFDKVEDTCTYWLSAGKRTPLMYAAWHANNEVVDYLLATGADPNAKDTNGHDYKFYLSQNDYQKNT